MLQNLLGFFIIGAWAVLILMVSRIISGKYKSTVKNYSIYPKIEAEVAYSTDNRWVVEFEDESGEMVLGMDDEIIFSYFNNNIPRVRRHTKEWVYYWPYDRKGAHFRINGREMKYLEID